MLPFEAFPAPMKTSPQRTVKLDIASRYEMLEMVQTILARVAETAGFDEETAHYMSVAVRESVVNAIKHGNRNDEARRVQVAFTVAPETFRIEVRDEGGGFDPETVPNPLAEENLLKPYGRGIFFMKSFMDDVSYSFGKRGGTVVRLTKKIPARAS